MFTGRNKHAVFDHCLHIYKHYEDMFHIDSKHVFECIQRHIFDELDFPDSQVVLGFFYVAHLRYANLMPERKPKPKPGLNPSAPGNASVSDMQKIVDELRRRLEEIETLHKSDHPHYARTSQGDVWIRG